MTTAYISYPNSAPSGVVFPSSGTLATIQGVTDGSSAAPGVVGELISAARLFASRTSITSTSETTMTTISLTAGQWLIFSNVGYLPAASTSVTKFSLGVSLTTNAMPGSSTIAAPSSVGEYSLFLNQAASVPGTTRTVSASAVPVNISATTSFFLIARSDFTVSTMEAWGSIYALRVR